jgi:methionyl-tRNA formyltransferase
MKPKILFMGTPEFALPSLKILLEQDQAVIGVVTQPDRPKGRGKQPAPPPLKVFAEAHHLSVLQPERVRSPEFLELFGRLAPDLVVVVAFGQILPKEILEQPRLGCINVHPSLLPGYRGAAPLNWASSGGRPQPASRSCRWTKAWIPALFCCRKKRRSVIRKPSANFMTGWPSGERNGSWKPSG